MFSLYWAKHTITAELTLERGASNNLKSVQDYRITGLLLDYCGLVGVDQRIFHALGLLDYSQNLYEITVVADPSLWNIHLIYQSLNKFISIKKNKLGKPYKRLWIIYIRSLLLLLCVYDQARPGMHQLVIPVNLSMSKYYLFPKSCSNIYSISNNCPQQSHVRTSLASHTLRIGCGLPVRHSVTKMSTKHAHSRIEMVSTSRYTVCS